MTLQARLWPPIALPEGEVPLIERWDTRALWLDCDASRIDRFAVGEMVRAGSTHVWGDLEWRAMAARVTTWARSSSSIPNSAS